MGRSIGAGGMLTTRGGGGDVDSVRRIGSVEEEVHGLGNVAGGARCDGSLSRIDRALSREADTNHRDRGEPVADAEMMVSVQWDWRLSSSSCSPVYSPMWCRCTETCATHAAQAAQATGEASCCGVERSTGGREEWRVEIYGRSSSHPEATMTSDINRSVRRLAYLDMSGCSEIRQREDRTALQNAEGGVSLGGDNAMMRFMHACSMMKSRMRWLSLTVSSPSRPGIPLSQPSPVSRA